MSAAQGGGAPAGLEEYFRSCPKAAVAFSGGADSAYVLYAVKQYAQEGKAYYVQSEFQPRFEREDAERLAAGLGVPLEILPLPLLCRAEIRGNPADRCYFCKKAIFTAVAQAARRDGFPVLLDGTNASDSAGDRPGMRALRELAVRSPLRECGLTKARVRELSREAGLFTWDKPAYACLATRIPTGEEITEEKLAAVEQAEDFLSGLGFAGFRVRTRQGEARLELRREQWPLLWERRGEVLAALKPLFSSVSLDLEGRP